MVEVAAEGRHSAGQATKNVRASRVKEEGFSLGASLSFTVQLVLLQSTWLDLPTFSAV